MSLKPTFSTEPRSTAKAEVEALWLDLQDTFNNDLDLKVFLEREPGGNFYFALRVQTFVPFDRGTGGILSTWAEVRIYNALYLISWRQLFDLLIVARDNLIHFSPLQRDEIAQP